MLQMWKLRPRETGTGHRSTDYEPGLGAGVLLLHPSHLHEAGGVSCSQQGGSGGPTKLPQVSSWESRAVRADSEGLASMLQLLVSRGTSALATQH